MRSTGFISSSMNSLDQAFFSNTNRLVAYGVWTASSLCFLAGVASKFPPENAWIEALVIACMLFAQYFSMANYSQRKTFREFLVIISILVWAIGFALRRLDIIDTSLYAAVVALFVGSVVVVRSRP